MILPLLPDPTDIVVPNDMTVLADLPANSFYYWIPEQGVELMKGFPVPRGMIGQHEWYGLLPRQLGPKVLWPSGEIVFEPVGDYTAPPVVDPTTAFLQQYLGAQVGGYSSMGPDIIGPAEATNSLILQGGDPLDEFDKIMLPRRALHLTNLSGKRLFPRMPASYYDNELVEGGMTESTSQWIISGQALDSTGTALAGCTVYLLQTGKLVLSPDVFANPVLGITTSDAGGNYSFQVASSIAYQVIAYKPGGTDVAGITRNDVVPVVA